ncbi:DNA-binding protein H-NS [Burkholderiales bacterium 8X]|nr:DNA-binding protein H-NS [Burkholderiales bacterium 8X]
MAKTFQQIKKQIEELQKEAEQLRTREIGGVVDRIKMAIKEYGLTAEQLGFGSSGRSAAPKSGATSKRAAGAAFADENGNTWGGRGPRPAWLRAAIEAGRSPDEFRMSRGRGGARKSAATPKAGTSSRTKQKPKRQARVSYRDSESGKQWAGMGPKPAWLKDLLANGKSLEDLAVHQ